MKKLIILSLALMTGQINCVATKLQNGKRIDVERMSTICAFLEKLQEQNPELLHELYLHVTLTRSKTKCFVTPELKEKLLEFIRSNRRVSHFFVKINNVNPNADFLWDAKDVIYPDVRHLVKAACKLSQQGSIEVRKPTTKS